ncbi:hypothetical protein FB382_001356 [Nocardioides ginsengisegetis]|uniref:Uncharacterized protein n=1 Tax=Nocardioides ginsengisegetis TaxID=661491 RepID=A0A7W3IYM6_9ACTN|nr:hypothetical protein [Nocardioides ginsengisegetis]MBA8803065.1 hypothetical protein [Nocardioides ginsengisegetis]
MQQWMVPVVVGVLALLAVVLLVALLRVRAGTARELASARAEAASLRTQVEEIERRLAAPERTRPVLETGYVITHLGEEESVASRPVERVDTALFADLVLRETVVKAASLAHGVRRALAPEVRNRIRFEMRREVKRARKQRRADVREARRDWEARQRADLDEGSAA